MRHLWSLIAGVVVAPLAWGLLAMGQDGASDTVAVWDKDNAFDTVDLIQPGAYLAGAGILLGLIATLRISPLGALVAALGYLGLAAGMFIEPFAVRDAVPDSWKIFGEPIPLRVPLENGTLLAVGALLLVAVFSAKRWRRWPVAVAETAAVEEGADAWPDTQVLPGPSPDEPTVPTATAYAPPGTPIVQAPASPASFPSARESTAVQAPPMPHTTDAPIAPPPASPPLTTPPPTAPSTPPAQAARPPAPPHSPPPTAPSPAPPATAPPTAPSLQPPAPPTTAPQTAPSPPPPLPHTTAAPTAPPPPAPPLPHTTAAPTAPPPPPSVATPPEASSWPPPSPAAEPQSPHRTEPPETGGAAPRHAADDNNERPRDDNPPSPWAAPPPSR